MGTPEICGYCGLTGHAAHHECCGRSMTTETCSHCFPETPVMTKAATEAPNDDAVDEMKPYVFPDLGDWITGNGPGLGFNFKV